MQKLYPKSLAVRLCLCLAFLSAAFIIHSCKKEIKANGQDAAITDPNVLAAQAWYNSTYPAVSSSSTGTNLATQSTNAQQASKDWSKVLSPYWSKAAAFTSKKGLNIVEAPALKNGDMAFTRTIPAVLSKFNFAQSGSLTSLLIIKQDKQFAVYAMTFIADSSYLKGDYSKLANNTYRKRDKDFTGWVLYHKMDGTFVNGWRYINGQVTAPVYQRLAPTTSGPVIQSVASPKVNVAQVCDYTLISRVWEECDNSNPPNCSYWLEPLYIISTCTDVTDPSGGDGTPSSPTPPPPPCVPPAGGSTPPAAPAAVKLKTNGITTLVAQQPPPVDPGGEIDPPPVLICPVQTPPTIDTLSKIIKGFCDSVNASQKQDIQTSIAQFITENCAQAGIYAYFISKNLSFSFCTSSSAYNNGHPIGGGSDVGSGTITFNSDLISIEMDEELYHQYQNSIYLGGTGQYGNNGRADIEFEAKLFHDIVQPPTLAGALTMNSQNVNTAYGGDIAAYNNDVGDYAVWLRSITNNNTTYPKSISDVDQTKYNHFLDIFAKLNPGDGPPIYLTPQAIFVSLSYNCK